MIRLPVIVVSVLCGFFLMNSWSSQLQEGSSSSSSKDCKVNELTIPENLSSSSSKDCNVNELTMDCSVNTLTIPGGLSSSSSKVCNVNTLTIPVIVRGKEKTSHSRWCIMNTITVPIKEIKVGSPITSVLSYNSGEEKYETLEKPIPGTIVFDTIDIMAIYDYNGHFGIGRSGVQKLAILLHNVNKYSSILASLKKEGETFVNLNQPHVIVTKQKFGELIGGIGFDTTKKKLSEDEVIVLEASKEDHDFISNLAPDLCLSLIAGQKKKLNPNLKFAQLSPLVESPSINMSKRNKSQCWIQ